MRVPSLSSGCEIAQFFVRYMGPNRVLTPLKSASKMYSPPNEDFGRLNKALRVRF
jgi:hypothetical protein